MQKISILELEMSFWEFNQWFKGLCSWLSPLLWQMADSGGLPQLTQVTILFKIQAALRQNLKAPVYLYHFFLHE